VIRYEPRRHGILTRRDIAEVLASISPMTEPTNDYLRGYMDALYRVAVGCGIAVNGDATQAVQVVEVTP
jgi:hypothetical protein